MYNKCINNIHDFVDIHCRQLGIQYDSTGTDVQKLTIANSIIHQVAGDALQLIFCKATIGNSQISNAGYNCVNLIGGDYEFVHCTLANYFSWNVKRGAALQFSNHLNNEPYPLYNASFYNCLIAGSSSDELYGSALANDDVPFNYYFSHCLINSIVDEGEQLYNIIWKKDDNFILMDSRTQEYNFDLTADSEAINTGDIEAAQRFPVDLKGRLRLADEAPDAGCYEWVNEID